MVLGWYRDGDVREKNNDIDRSLTCSRRRIVAAFCSSNYGELGRKRAKTKQDNGVPINGKVNWEKSGV